MAGRARRRARASFVMLLAGVGAASCGDAGADAFLEPAEDPCSAVTRGDPIDLQSGSVALTSSSGRKATAVAVGHLPSARIAPSAETRAVLSLPLGEWGYTPSVDIRVVGTGALEGLVGRACEGAAATVFVAVTPGSPGEGGIRIELDGDEVDTFPVVVAAPVTAEVAVRTSNRVEAVFYDADGERIYASDVLWQGVPSNSLRDTRGNLAQLSQYGDPYQMTVFASFGGVSASVDLVFDRYVNAWVTELP